jgi:hypothetical protein
MRKGYVAIAARTVAWKSRTSWSWRSVRPAPTGITMVPSASAPNWKPKPPVNRPKDAATSMTSSAVTPAAASERAITSRHWPRSAVVYGLTIGAPVVPDDMWTRRIGSRPEQVIP